MTRTIIAWTSQKNPEGLEFDPRTTHSLGKCNRSSGSTSSGDSSRLVPTYTIHTATTQCGSAWQLSRGHQLQILAYGFLNLQFFADFTMDFTKISLDFSLTIAHKIINNRLHVHPWNWSFAYTSLSYHIYLLGQYVINMHVCNYIHHSCVEAEFYKILLVNITSLLDFRFQDFKISQDFRRSVWDLATVGDP